MIGVKSMQVTQTGLQTWIYKLSPSFRLYTPGLHSHGILGDSFHQYISKYRFSITYRSIPILMILCYCVYDHDYVSSSWFMSLSLAQVSLFNFCLNFDSALHFWVCFSIVKIKNLNLKLSWSPPPVNRLLLMCSL